MFPAETVKTASHCRHYAMCKIDYLGTGLCPSAVGGNFVSFYPQGRMDLLAALAQKHLKVTKGLIEAAESCNLCGICDKQCYFVTQLRPLEVMKELKKYVNEHKMDVQPVEADPVLEEIKAVVGEKWASNDPAYLVPYADDPCPVTPPVMPRIVTCPKTAEQIQSIVKICNKHNLEYNVRGNGSSVIGVVMSPGVVIDTNRMQQILFDRDNWKVTVGPGVSAFDLQKEAHKRGFRVCTAESSALVIANIMCSGIMSNFSHAYGCNADNFVDAEFIGPDGSRFNLNDPGSPNLFGYQKEVRPLPGICTEVQIKLHPVTPDEDALLVPFSTLSKALQFSRQLSIRRVGVAVGILGSEYISTFLSPTEELADTMKDVFPNRLGINYLVLIVGDTYALETVRKMSDVVIDSTMARSLILGLPGLAENQWLEIVEEFGGDDEPYMLLGSEAALPFINAALSPSAQNIADAVHRDFKDFYNQLYSKPHMSDLLWLSTFRIVTPRMGRKKHIVAFIVYVPLDKPEIIEQMNDCFTKIGKTYDIKNDFGFITPLDLGKRAFFEYDFYIDQTDQEEIAKMGQAMGEIAGMIESFSARVPGVKWIRYTLHQGFCRSESLLFS